MKRKRPRYVAGRVRAALYELHSLGMLRSEAAELLRIGKSWIYRLTPELKWPSEFLWARCERLLRKQPMTIIQLAERIGYKKSPSALYSLLWQHGVDKLLILRLKHRPAGPRKLSRYKRRQFEVPPERLNEYHELRRLGLTVEECGWNMGLIPRPPARVGMNAGMDRSGP